MTVFHAAAAAGAKMMRVRVMAAGRQAGTLVALAARV